MTTIRFGEPGRSRRELYRTLCEKVAPLKHDRHEAESSKVR